MSEVPLQLNTMCAERTMFGCMNIKYIQSILSHTSLLSLQIGKPCTFSTNWFSTHSLGQRWASTTALLEGRLAFSSSVQGYLTHKKPPPPLGQPNGPRQMLLQVPRGRCFLMSEVPL